MRIAVIGAGSTYTPELVSGLVREHERIQLRDLVLHDIDRERREVVGGLAGRILERQGFSGVLAVTGDLDFALDGADAVLIQIRVGGQAARLRDETIPATCSCVGQETTGAGGLAKAMRTVPLEARTTFSRICPNCLQGPHQGAQKSTITGCSNEASTTSAMKVAVSGSFCWWAILMARLPQKLLVLEPGCCSPSSSDRLRMFWVRQTTATRLPRQVCWKKLSRRVTKY